MKLKACWVCVVSVSMIAVPAVGWAQSVVDKCDGMMADFAFARSDLPDWVACKATGTRVEGTIGKSFVEMGITHLVVEKKGDDGYRYFATGIDFRPSSGMNRVSWEQTFENGVLHYRRIGYRNRLDVMRDMKVKLPEGVPQRVKTKYPKFDVFNLPLANDGAYIASEIPKEYVEKYFVLNGRINGAEEKLGGEVLGWWDIQGDPGAVVDVTFDEKFNSYPIRVEWRSKKTQRQKPSEVRLKERVDSLVQTKYASVRLGKKEFVLPSEVQIDSVGCNDGDDWTNTKLKFEWVASSKDLTFPFDAKVDWARPVLELFDKP
ncbi:hypothetical protein [Planctomycetes bacterium TBK1r]|uniref:DUF3108 domain-containing protein n=1 Tax=Stieleria magnilauensis TaxID=2527963 RepID=A0ABX5XHI0_9BACT|nr:hypothetical protein TBK1r_01820 [Planctomycetes bacterium TBK1r]